MTPEEAAREIRNKVVAAHCAHESRATDCIRCADIVHEKMAAIIRQAIEAEREELARGLDIMAEREIQNGRHEAGSLLQVIAFKIRARSSEPAKSGEGE